ncbi:FAD-dependent oxidoreductase, partial [Vibrio parahaemolyticus]|nr:FAD-dependent oxidoreductase [Vibrio parahaemolyticus]
YDKCGSLVLAFNDEDEKKLEELYENGLKNGVEGLRIIDKDEILNMEPNVSQDVTKALYCSEAGIVCPFNATFAFIENAMDNGVELFL